MTSDDDNNQTVLSVLNHWRLQSLDVIMTIPQDLINLNYYERCNQVHTAVRCYWQHFNFFQDKYIVQITMEERFTFLLDAFGKVWTWDNENLSGIGNMDIGECNTIERII